MDWFDISYNLNTLVHSWRSQAVHSCSQDIVVELGNVERRDHREMTVTWVEQRPCSRLK